MQQITITASNFGALKIKRFLQQEGVEDFNIIPVRQMGTVEDELKRILSIVCDYYKVPHHHVQIHYRGREAVQVKKVYAYLAKTKFPSVADKMLVSVLRLDRSTLTNHKLEVFDRLEGRTKNIPDNLILLNDINAINKLCS